MAKGVGQQLLAVPFPEMILKLASAIAEGQFKLDMVSMKVAKLMSEIPIDLPDITSDDAGSVVESTMLGAGFQPTFYQFTDTIIEVKMAISMNKTTEMGISVSASGGFGPVSVSVDASYSSKYSYSVEGSSLMRTKITPVPPNQFLTKLYEMKAAILQEKQMEVMRKTEEEMEAKEDAKGNPKGKSK